jgi:poly(3-hydroxybutyrate) depolymerase
MRLPRALARLVRVRFPAATALAALACLGCSAKHVDSAGTIRYEVSGLEQVAIPARRGAPLLVLLHGRGARPDDFLQDAKLQKALRTFGKQAPNVVIPLCSDHCYWHDRIGTAWGKYVLYNVIPAAIRRMHADPRRVAIGGISMGGFGALDLARLAPKRFCAVAGHSAALWRTAGETAPGAFDHAADFARHDVLHLPFAYRGPLWIDMGTDDPFRGAGEEFARTHHARLHVWPGSHSWSYWNAHWADYLRFYVSSCT